MKSINEKQELQELLFNWISWLFTRSFYGTALPENLMKNIKDSHLSTGEAPNARNDALCCAFNLIISDALENDRDNALCFLYAYLKNYRPEPIKTLAARLGINSDTVYFRADKWGTIYYNKALQWQRLNSMIQREVKADNYD